jgi:hypothetical protein
MIHYLLIIYPPACETVKHHCVDYAVMQKELK